MHECKRCLIYIKWFLVKITLQIQCCHSPEDSQVNNKKKWATHRMVAKFLKVLWVETVIQCVKQPSLFSVICKYSAACISSWGTVLDTEHQLQLRLLSLGASSPASFQTI